MKDMTATVHELRELKLLREELEAQITSLEDQLKEEMTEQGVNMLRGSDWKVTWSTVNTKRLNQTMLKEQYPEIAKECTKSSSYRRLTVT